MNSAITSGLIALAFTSIVGGIVAVDAVTTDKVAFIGDSLTVGYGATTDYVDIIESNEEYETRRWAVNGATSLRWISEYPNMLNDLDEYNPDKVVIMLGGNSYLIGRGVADEGSHLRQLADRVHNQTPDAEVVIIRYYDMCGYGFDCTGYANGGACDVVGNCTNEPKPPQRWQDYGQMMQTVADSSDSRYIDLGSWTPSRAEIYSDRVHLNNMGHQELANKVLESL